MSVARATVIEPPPSHEPKVEKFSDGSLTCIRFSGVIDERFEGKKTASGIKAKKLVLDLGRVVRVSSFGVREWLDFIAAVGRNVEDLYLINCAPKVMNQLNIVSGFTGKGRVVSFFAPYHCEYCDTENIVLLNVDRDFDAISKLKAPDRACAACGNPETFDDDPASYFAFTANQPRFEIDPVVSNFLITKLGYSVADLSRRMQAEKIFEGRFIMLKLAGNLDGSFPAEKLAEGVEGTVVVEVSGVGGVDPAGAAQFRKFLSFLRPHVERVLLVGCEASFLQQTIQPEELSDRVQILSLGLPFVCDKCQNTTTHLIDVEAHHEVLKIAMAPQQKCPECGGSASCQPHDAMRALLPSLPKPATTPDLRTFIKKGQKKKKEKKADAAEAASTNRAVMILLPVILVAVAGLGAFVWQQQKKSEQIVERAVTTLNRAAKTRPAWIASDTPFSGYCTDLANRMACVGISSYLPSKEAAKAEASNVALEALANAIALRIEDESFRTHVAPTFRDARQLALGDLEDARIAPSTPEAQAAFRAARSAHRNVAAALRRTGGTAVPAQSSDWYWEEYERLNGDGTEFRVFVRYDVTPASMDALVSTYSTTKSVLGVTVLTSFPSVGWGRPDGSVGAFAVDVKGGPLKNLGVSVGSVFLDVAEQPVRDASDFATRIQDEFDTKASRDGALRFVLMDQDGEKQKIGD